MKWRLAAGLSLIFHLFSPNAFAQDADYAPPIQVVPETARDGFFTILPGVHVETRLDEKLRFTTVQSGAAPLSPDMPVPPFDKENETLTNLGPTKITNSPGTVSFTLWTSKDLTILKMQNYTTDPLIYIAALVSGPPVPENFRLTTICAVPPGKVGVEGWPQAVDGIAIIRILRPPASDQPLCVDPTENLDDPKFYPLQVQ